MKLVTITTSENNSNIIVRFSPPSINKNDKSDREKNHEYLANGSSDFNRTKKFGISAKNYTREELSSMIRTRVWMSRLRPRTRPTIPGNSTGKHKGKLNPK
jgi:hypothetical protein